MKHKVDKELLILLWCKERNPVQKGSAKFKQLVYWTTNLSHVTVYGGFQRVRH